MNPSDYAALKVIDDQMLQSAINNSSLADAGFNRSDLGLSFACNICVVGVMTYTGCTDLTIYEPLKENQPAKENPCGAGMYGVYDQCLGGIDNATVGYQATENCTSAEVASAQPCWWLTPVPGATQQNINECLIKELEPLAPECSVCLFGYSQFGTPDSDTFAPCHAGSPNMTGGE